MTTTKLTGSIAGCILGVALIAPSFAFAGPIHDAARRADIAAVASLVKNGAYIDAPDTDGSTPLIIAALGGETQLVEVLIILGADLEKRNDRGMTALHAAAWSGDLDAFKLLEAAGGNVNDANNKFGVTPLIVAAEEDRLSVVSYLIGEHVDLDVSERHGYSALTRAGYHGHEEIINVLLEAGAACQEADPYWLKACTAFKARLGI